MKITETKLPGVLVIEPKVFGDDRGFFFESWNARAFREATGVDAAFVQDNHSRSARHVLRGIHYQVVKPQGKLVRVVQGEVWDIAVDLRRSAPTFGQWFGVRLAAADHRQLWIPPGFGHGFVVLSETADFLYKTTEYWIPEYDRGIAWNDPQLGIDWQLDGAVPQLAKKDAAAPLLAAAEVYD
ncbi:MAG: dTDP-4-dehydrorhamnose 3,5-epimerase [Burkholderiaceae bacterium]|jgi:dTDP-4-dehydrorhamnose 3,5-epimerase